MQKVGVTESFARSVCEYLCFLCVLLLVKALLLFLQMHEAFLLLFFL